MFRSLLFRQPWKEEEAGWSLRTTGSGFAKLAWKSQQNWALMSQEWGNVLSFHRGAAETNPTRNHVPDLAPSAAVAPIRRLRGQPLCATSGAVKRKKRKENTASNSMQGFFSSCTHYVIELACASCDHVKAAVNAIVVLCLWDIVGQVSLSLQCSVFHCPSNAW